MAEARAWDVDHRAETPRATIELCRRTWPTPFELILTEEQPTISLNLTGRAFERKSARYRDAGLADFQPMGDVLFQPRRTTLESRGAGGRQRFLRVGLLPAPGSGELELTPDPSNPKVQRMLVDLRAAAVLGPLRRIVTELVSPGLASGFMLDGLTTLLWAEIARTFGAVNKEAQTRGGLAPWQMRRIEERLKDSTAVPPTVTELAQLVRLSPRHLARGWRAGTGGTLSGEVERLRQQRAEGLVVAGHHQLKEVAAQLGFASQSSFSSAFKRKTGLSPQDFARRQR